MQFGWNGLRVAISKYLEIYVTFNAMPIKKNKLEYLGYLYWMCLQNKLFYFSNLFMAERIYGNTTKEIIFKVIKSVA